MAGGMHMAAAGQLEGGRKNSTKEEEDESNLVGVMEKGETVEITGLSEEMSTKAAEILDQRRKRSNPVAAYMRNLQCDTNGEIDTMGDSDSERKQQSPLWRLLVNSMPVISWLPQLRPRVIRSDIIAGLTVGVMVIPQSMSYANIAGLDYIYGMYSACVPTFVYALFGQSRQLAVGPVAMVSLLVEAGLRDQIPSDMARTDSCKAWFAGQKNGLEQAAACPVEYAEMAFMLSVMIGVMQIVGSVLKMGFLVSFLGHPVTSGFTSGAAIIIGLSQVKYWLGFKLKKSQYVYVTVIEIFKGIGEGKTKFMPLLFGLVWLAFLMTIKKISQKYPRLRLLSALGPLISCVVGILLVWLIDPLRDDYHVGFVGYIPDGMFPVSVGQWNFSLIPLLMPTAISACLIGYMESVAIGKNLAAKHGYEIDAGQEMMALGLANLVGGCFSCYPVTGSFSRSAVMNSTGGQTQLGGFISALVMLCTLLFLTKLFWFLPEFALASIVINSIIPLVAFSEAKKLYKIKRNDFILWVVAFIGTMLLGVLLGIALAVALSLVIVIYESVRPQITILWRIPGTSIYRNVKQESSGTFIPNVFICRIGSSLYFANAAFVKDMLLAYADDLRHVNRTEYIILEMTSVISLDSTAVHVIHDVVSDFRSRHIQVAFTMVGNRAQKTMRKAGLNTFIGQQWFFPTVNEAVQYCLRHQHAKKNSSSENSKPLADLAVGTTKVDIGNEIGFSNSMNEGCTTLFITLVDDLPGIMADITSLFKRRAVCITRAQIEPFSDNGAKHTYMVTKKDLPLSDFEQATCREDLDIIINAAVKRKTKPPTSQPEKGAFMSPPLLPQADIAHDSSFQRLQRLEDAFNNEQENNRLLREQMQAQNKRLDLLLQLHEKQEAGLAGMQANTTNMRMNI
jgi:sulfate transporter 4